MQKQYVIQKFAGEEAIVTHVLFDCPSSCSTDVS